MKLHAVPENLLERIALRAGVVPTHLGDTIVAMTLARTIMVATKLGIFEALAKRSTISSSSAISSTTSMRPPIAISSSAVREPCALAGTWWSRRYNAFNRLKKVGNWAHFPTSTLQPRVRQEPGPPGRSQHGNKKLAYSPASQSGCLPHLGPYYRPH